MMIGEIAVHIAADWLRAEQSVADKYVQIENVDTVGWDRPDGGVVRRMQILPQAYVNDDISVAQCFIIHRLSFHIDTTEKSPFVHVSDKFLMNPKKDFTSLNGCPDPMMLNLHDLAWMPCLRQCSHHVEMQTMKGDCEGVGSDCGVTYVDLVLSQAPLVLAASA